MMSACVTVRGGQAGEEDEKMGGGDPGPRQVLQEKQGLLLWVPWGVLWVCPGGQYVGEGTVGRNKACWKVAGTLWITSLEKVDLDISRELASSSVPEGWEA